MRHFGEEPPIVGSKGSGAVFFSGCPLHCVFCQNAAISGGDGKIYSPSELEESLLALGTSAQNINLVTAGHYLDAVLPILEKIKPKLSVPIVYNSGGYERAEKIRLLDGIIDVYLPDYKYFSPDLAEKYSHRKDYPEVAAAAIEEMVRQQPEVVSENGVMKRGVMIRHLVLPSHKDDSLAVTEDIAARWGKKVYISLMSQYTPSFNRSDFRELDRKVTTYEYNAVAERALTLGLNGFMQQRSSSGDALVPKFDV